MSANVPAFASLELPHRIERAFRALAYIAFCVPLGVLGLLALVEAARTSAVAPLPLDPPQES